MSRVLYLKDHPAGSEEGKAGAGKTGGFYYSHMRKEEGQSLADGLQEGGCNGKTQNLVTWSLSIFIVLESRLRMILLKLVHTINLP